MDKLRVFEMFAGYGTSSFALKNIGIDIEIVGFSEIDKYAIKCFKMNHGDNIINYGDCTTINPNIINDFDLLTAGFPCQTFSTSGKMQGEEDKRGLLFNDIIRIAEVKKPKYMLLENVKGLLSKKFNNTFNKILSELDRIGYNVKFKVINTKDFGIPQNRNRIYFVCVRKDLKDKFINFEWPLSFDLDVGWRYFEDDNKNFIKVKKTPSRDKMRIKCKNITNEKICGTITTKQDRYPNSGIIDFEDYYRFLTPRECFRLQGFVFDEVNLNEISILQQYKLAGNGQSLNVVCNIYKNLLGEYIYG